MYQIATDIRGIFPLVLSVSLISASFRLTKILKKTLYPDDHIRVVFSIHVQGIFTTSFYVSDFFCSDDYDVRIT